MTSSELQAEEIEVLRSIYDGDDNFKELSTSSVQYMFGEKGTPKSFLLEILWVDDYPNVLPNISMDAFYNRHISQNIKTQIKDKITDEAKELIGMSMSYTIIEWVKEKLDELTADITEPELNLNSMKSEIMEIEKEEQPQSSVKLKQPKVQLTKRQKRRLADKLDAKGEMARGWNWVDIVKHLSQTGGSNDDS